jgi:hypothetical protein
MHHGPRGDVLDVGRRRRTVPPALHRALTRRDQGCRFPGCGLRLCDAHHLEHWADGGATRLDNLVLLCRRHHRAVHEEGFAVELLGGGEVRIRRPDGRVPVDAPALSAIQGDAVSSLVRRLDREGTAVDGEASLPSWDGRPADYGAAIDFFRAVAARERLSASRASAAPPPGAP